MMNSVPTSNAPTASGSICDSDTMNRVSRNTHAGICTCRRACHRWQARTCCLFDRAGARGGDGLVPEGADSGGGRAERGRGGARPGRADSSEPPHRLARRPPPWSRRGEGCAPRSLRRSGRTAMRRIHGGPPRMQPRSWPRLRLRQRQPRLWPRLRLRRPRSWSRLRPRRSRAWPTPGPRWPRTPQRSRPRQSRVWPKSRLKRSTPLCDDSSMREQGSGTHSMRKSGMHVSTST